MSLQIDTSKMKKESSFKEDQMIIEVDIWVKFASRQIRLNTKGTKEYMKGTKYIYHRDHRENAEKLDQKQIKND